jgi:pSer/pThr/pTyr-binding forkhead associated (FHA) protein
MADKVNWSEVGGGDVPSTTMESMDDFQLPPSLMAPYTPTIKETAPQQEARQDARPYRPVYRPPMALLVVVDDGRDDGERIRLRGETFTIGRTKGDLILGHDRMLSSEHAKLVREPYQDRFRWFLIDQNSSNGTFVRAKSAYLTHDQEFLIGSTRFRFNAALAGSALLPPPGSGDTKTQGWQSVKPTDLIPSIQQLQPDGQGGERHFLNDQTVLIGRASACQVQVDDPMMNSQHARLTKDARDRWQVENLRSLNGLWVRMSRMAIDRNGQFLLGEQRFLFYSL